MSGGMTDCRLYTGQNGHSIWPPLPWPLVGANLPPVTADVAVPMQPHLGLDGRPTFGKRDAMGGAL